MVKSGAVFSRNETANTHGDEETGRPTNPRAYAYGRPGPRDATWVTPKRNLGAGGGGEAPGIKDYLL